MMSRRTAATGAHAVTSGTQLVPANVKEGGASLGVVGRAG